MPLVVECPSCGKNLNVPDNLVGKAVRCADCAGTFMAERPEAARPPSSRTSVSSRRERDEDMDAEDDRHEPRSRGRDRSRDEIPHRGGLILTLGIISLAVVLVGLLAFFVFAPAGLPFPILGLILGLVAWLMGGKDLKQMKSGTMDPSGQGMTMGGYVCGIIGTIVHALTLVCSCVAVVAALMFGMAVFGIAAWGAAALPTAPVGVPQKNLPPRKNRIELGQLRQIADYLPGNSR